MKKIGLFLGPKPSGGEFQYYLTMIDAVGTLPTDQYTVVFGYTSNIWVDYLTGYIQQKVALPSGFLSKSLSLLWTRTGMPMGIWRKICPLFDPMAKALLKENCDIWIFPYPTARSFQIPVPALVSIHDLMHRYEKRFKESASSWEFFCRERNLTNICRWSKGVIVDSKIGQQHVQECYEMESERIHTLPYIPPRYMHNETPPGFDKRYILPEKYLFYPAQFWEHKNHKKLIEAAILLKGKLPDLKLVFTGATHNAYDSAVQLVRENNLVDNVTFLGYVPNEDMPEIYRRARALVMPTFYGPTNIPPLEAFVAGCPVAVSAIYAMPEQVGDAALLFNPESVTDIADCIVKLWTDDEVCADLVKKGKMRVSDWGQRQFNERLLQIIGEVP